MGVKPRYTGKDVLKDLAGIVAIILALPGVGLLAYGGLAWGEGIIHSGEVEARIVAEAIGTVSLILGCFALVSAYLLFRWARSP